MPWCICSKTSKFSVRSFFMLSLLKIQCNCFCSCRQWYTDQSSQISHIGLWSCHYPHYQSVFMMPQPHVHWIQDIASTWCHLSVYEHSDSRAIHGRNFTTGCIKFILLDFEAPSSINLHVCQVNWFIETPMSPQGSY